jgi:hypothetical protein
MLASLVVVTSIGGIARLQDQSGSYLVDTGSAVGTPQELAADLNYDLPEPPSWLTQPPPPTTTTTTAPPTTTTTTTTTTSTTSTTTAAPTTTSTTAAPTTTTTAPTSTTATTYPSGAIVASGAMAAKNSTDKCFQVEAPGTVGSSTSRRNCDNSAGQVLAAVGTPSVIALKWTDAANYGLCAEASGTTIVMTTCNGSAAQLFNVDLSGGWYHFTSQSTGLCLASKSTGLEIETCGGSNRQKFAFS